MTGGVFDNLPLSYPDSDYLPLNPQKDSPMTDTPDHIWAIDANGERLWETEDHGPHCTEYTRRALSDGRYTEMVVLLDKQRAEVARLKAALAYGETDP